MDGFIAKCVFEFSDFGSAVSVFEVAGFGVVVACLCS